MSNYTDYHRFMTNHLSFYLSLNILLIIIGHNLLVVIFNFMLNHSYGKEKQLKENMKKLLNDTNQSITFLILIQT